jgi:hypothetical protein
MMKGIIAKTAMTLCVLTSLGWLTGCETDGDRVGYRDVVDPCYPQRYWYSSRQEVNAAMAPQVNNGHILDQTVWNYHFEPGTDRLTPGGMEHLAYLARRRPCPDPVVYLQTAQDIPYDQATPEKFPDLRATLDNRRIQAVQSYLVAQSAGRNANFEVFVHDPSDPGIAAPPAGITIQKMYLGSQGNLPLTAGAGATNASGGAGPVGGAGAGGSGR